MAPGDDQVVCHLCGAVAAGDAVRSARVSWVRATERGAVVWTCDGCSRTHLRSMEAKLDSAWW